LADDDASRAFEHVLGYDNTAAHRKTVHEPAIARGAVEPALLDAPPSELFFYFALRVVIAVVARRRP
jgi:hypothetical protein